MPARDALALIVVDLGFGDSGKGLVTDFLTRDRGARTVVRFNGGAQAGHNVVTPDGRHHTFSQLGAGSFVPGVHTFLSRFFVLHPTALAVEAEVLADKGVPDALARLSIDEDALVSTPFHQALNRLRELARGRGRHGSTGVGFGETVRLAREEPEDAIRVRDFSAPARVMAKLRRLQERARADALDAARQTISTPEASVDWEVLRSSEIATRWLARAAATLAGTRVAGGDELRQRLRDGGSVVFEGAQGVLLDERFGFFPHCTFSACTAENALNLVSEHNPSLAVHRIGVLRTYLTRHGEGPLPTEDPELGRRCPERHNSDSAWQGVFRTGWPDLVLARYASTVCGTLEGLALTHLDAVERIGAWRCATRYETCEALPVATSIDARLELTRTLARAEPSYAECSVRELCERISGAVGAPCELSAFGPTARDVVVLG